MIRLVRNAPPLVLSPHLDDAVLSTYLILAAGPTVVVNVFAGVPDADAGVTIWDRLCGFGSSWQAATARLAEDEVALRAAGDTDAIYLRHLDALNRRIGPKRPLDLLAEIAERVPAASRVYAPLAGGPKAHPDHRIVRDAARLLLAYDDAPPVDLYADLPYCVRPGGWPRSLGGTVPDPPWTRRALREAPEAAALFDAIVRPLDAAARDRKQEVARLYRSQFDALDTKLRTRGMMSRESTWEREALLPLH